MAGAKGSTTQCLSNVNAAVQEMAWDSPVDSASQMKQHKKMIKHGHHTTHVAFMYNTTLAGDAWL